MPRKKGSLNIGLPSVSAVVGNENLESTKEEAPSKSYVSPVRRNKKGILTYVTEECHKELKLLAVQKGTNLQVEFEGMIAKYLTENGIDPSRYIEARE